MRHGAIIQNLMDNQKMPHNKLYIDKLEERWDEREERYMSKEPQLRDYQKQAVEQIEGSIAFGSNEICLSAPTSFGKTITISQFIKNQITEGKNVVFMMNLTALVEQTMNTLHSMNIPFKVVAAEYDGQEFDHRANVTIAMQQTLYSRIDKVNIDCDILVIDEFHRSFRTNTMEEVKRKLKPDIIVGVSATVYDEKGYQLPGVDTIETTTIRELTDNNHLTPLRTFSVEFSELMDYSDAGSGEYSENFLNGVLNNNEYNSNVVKAWEQVAVGKKTIVFATGITHAEALSAHFAQNGHKAMAYHSKLSKKDSKAIMDDFRNNGGVLVSVSKILVGFDDPSIECGIACRPTKTRRVWQQACGRMIRLFEGKTEAILLDCAQWTSEHGFYNEHYAPPEYGNKEGLKKVKEEFAVNVMPLIVNAEPTEVDRKLVIKKIEELENKKKQIPELQIRDLLAIYETSQKPIEILRVAYEMKRRKTGQTYTKEGVTWVADQWDIMMNDFPQYKTRLLKTLRTMARNKVAQGKKLNALHYTVKKDINGEPGWLRQQTPYKDYIAPDSVDVSEEVYNNYNAYDDIDMDEVPF